MPLLVLWMALFGCRTSTSIPAMPDTDGFEDHNTEWLQLTGRSDVVAVAETPGARWIATGGGLIRRDRDGSQVWYTPANSQLEGQVSALVAGRGSDLWLADQGGVARLSGDQFERHRYEGTQLGDVTGPVHLAWADGRLVAANGSAIAVLEDDTWTGGPAPEGILSSVASDAGGGLWAALVPEVEYSYIDPPVERGGGLVQFVDGAWRPWVGTASGLDTTWVHNVVGGPDGVVFAVVGHQSPSVVRFDGNAASELSPPAPLLGEVSMVWREDTLWLATGAELLSQTNDEWSGEPIPSPIDAVFLADSTGLPWVTTAGSLHFGRGEAWEEVSTPSSDLPTQNIRDMAISSDGTVWLATGDAGLLSLSPDRADWTPWNAGDSVLSVAVAPSGEVWAVNSERELVRVGGDRWPLPMPDSWGVPEVTVNGDCPGEAWVGIVHGADGGLAHLDDNGSWEWFDSADLPNHSVISVDCSPEHGVLAGTMYGNVALLRNGSWTHFDEAAAGAPSDYINDVLFDSAGQIWASHWWVDGGGVHRRTEGAWWAADLSTFGTPPVGATVMAEFDGQVYFVAQDQLGAVLTGGGEATRLAGPAISGARAMAADPSGNVWIANGVTLTVHNADGVAGLDRYIDWQAGR